MNEIRKINTGLELNTASAKQEFAKNGGAEGEDVQAIYGEQSSKLFPVIGGTTPNRSAIDKLRRTTEPKAESFKLSTEKIGDFRSGLCK